MNLLKRNSKVIIAFMLGVILTGGIVYAAVVASANEITYTTNKNTAINTVAGALNDLYSKASGTTTILWTNASPNSSFAEQTITLSDNLSNYSKIEIIYNTNPNNSSNHEFRNTFFINELFEYSVAPHAFGSRNTNSSNAYYVRAFGISSDNSLYFGGCFTANASGTKNQYMVPAQIIGIK